MTTLRLFLLATTIAFAATSAPCSCSSEDGEDPRAVGDVARLMAERPVNPNSGWKIFDGCPRVPEYPTAMVGVGSQLFVATADRIEVYNTETDTWAEEPIALPMKVATGLALESDHASNLFVVPGGKQKAVWKVSITDRQVSNLPDAPMDLARGSALAYFEDELYLTPGGKRDDFLVLRKGADQWEPYGRLGGKSPMDTTFGRTSGFLAAAGSAIYAFPNHHIHRYDGIKKKWRPGNWVAMKFLPCIDGGGVASDPLTDSLYCIGGFYSRSLAVIVPKRKESFLLRPRLPYPMTGEGDRLAIASVKGVPHLFTYAIEPENKLTSIPLPKLRLIDHHNDSADKGSPWHVFASYGGGNGVRHWTTKGWKADPGPMSREIRPSGTVGVMGGLDGQLFTMRRAYSRRIDLENDVFSFYPGYSLGRTLALGAAGIFDNEHSVYFMTGRSDYFLRRQVPDTVPIRKRPDGLLPSNKTAMDVLAPLPFESARCGALAYLDGGVFALRGGATREFARYDVELNTWEVLASLPDEALALGEQGGGLIATSTDLFAFTGDQVWRYDPTAKAWSRAGQLGFAMDWDGGMLAADGDRHVYITKGGVSARLGRLDLGTLQFEELLPRPPDVISVEGNRMAVLTVTGERRLYIHRGNNSNELMWIRLADFDTNE